MRDMKRLAFIFPLALSIFAFAEVERTMFGELSYKDGSTSDCMIVFRTDSEDNSFFCEIRRRINSRIRSQVFRGETEGNACKAKSADGRLSLYGVIEKNDFSAGVMNGNELLYSLSAKDGESLMNEAASRRSDGETVSETPPEPQIKREASCEEDKPDLAKVKVYAYKGKLSGKEGEKDAEIKASFSNGKNNNMNLVVMVNKTPESVSAEFYSGVADKGRFTAMSRDKSKLISGKIDSQKLEAEIKEEANDESSFFSGKR